MRLKLAILILYALGLAAPVAMVAGPHALERAEPSAAQVFESIIMLNLDGSHGRVAFDHKMHELLINPADDAPFKVKTGASCSGCHHTISPVGIPQLWKCSTCHRGEGNPANPKNAVFDEVWSGRAFHDSCVHCHQASAKGPVTCDGCHVSILSDSKLEATFEKLHSDLATE